MCLAVPGRIVEITGEDPLVRMARVDFSGVQKEVSLAYVPEAAVGDYVIVHVGFALQTVDEEEARQTLEMIEKMGEAADEAAP